MKHVEWITMAFLVAAGIAGAAQTFTDTYNLGSNVPLWGHESNKWTDNHPVGWSQTLSGFNRGRSIIEATSTIEGLSIDNVCWRFDNSPFQQKNDEYNKLVGLKDGFLVTRTPRVNLLSYQALMQSMTNASAGSSFRGASFGNRKRYYSYGLAEGSNNQHPPLILQASGDTLMPGEKPIPLATVPAPSAVVIGSIGIILVGWLRKRSDI